MNRLDDGATWKHSLRECIRECRATMPIPERASLSLADEWRCRIVGGSLIRWLEQHGPDFLQQREVLSHMFPGDQEPIVVFTSDDPGLVAAREIVGEDHPRVVWLRDEEFAGWSESHEDSGFEHHVHVWSRFRDEIDDYLGAEAREMYPLEAGAVYWQHSEGTMWGHLAGNGVDHLWTWDGAEPRLLEEAMGSWIS